MIFESMSKYDAEIAKCTEYYAKQCGAMEACRGQIAASNCIAANSRTLILDSQSRINRCQVDIPTRSLELKQHNEKCAAELKEMKERLAAIEGDIAIMTTILKMTDCDAKKFVQMRKVALLRCLNPCTKKSFITFQHKGLQQKIRQLRPVNSNKLVQETFADLFEGVESMGTAMSATQIDANVESVINKTSTSAENCSANEFLHRSRCRWSKNSGWGRLSYELQERFLLIQAGIKDNRDALMEDIADMEHNCEEVKATLEKRIKDDEDIVAPLEVPKWGVVLQFAEKSTKVETGDWVSNIVHILVGWQSLTFSERFAGRQPHPDGGAKCLPWAAERRCNMHPCPVDGSLSS